MVRTLHAGRSRSHPRRRLQPHGRRRPRGPDAARSAASTTRAITGCEPGRPSRYQDFTGTGNTLNMRSPHVLQLLMDSLRYWVEEMHVDGFRFDLASALARELYAVDRLSSFFDVIQQDPVISRVKLIAEPWDVGEGGYQVGNFPPGWAEWNGRYRDTVRRFWRGDPRRAAGAGHAARRQQRPLRFVRPPAARERELRHGARRVHAGGSRRRTTKKHNEANGENNRDGEPNNLSWNAASKDRPTDPADRPAAAAAAPQLPADALRISQGVPMLSGGDEVGRIAAGQQQRVLSRLAAQLDLVGSAGRGARLPPVRRAARARCGRAQPVLRRRTFLRGRGHGFRGRAVAAPRRRRDDRSDDWHDPRPARARHAARRPGDSGASTSPGQPIAGDTLLVLVQLRARPSLDVRVPPTASAGASGKSW